MREAFYGLRRFDDFAKAIGCGRAVLTARLQTLVEHDLLKRSPYQVAGERMRFEYSLTLKGIELLPALLALLQWGDRWAADPEGPAVLISHAGCDQAVSVSLRCAAGHDQLRADQLAPTPGPGARRVSTGKAKKQARSGATKRAAR
jgi:DNA-binding HxlR family transcriptional regulator